MRYRRMALFGDYSGNAKQQYTYWLVGYPRFKLISSLAKRSIICACTIVLADFPCFHLQMRATLKQNLVNRLQMSFFLLNFIGASALAVGKILSSAQLDDSINKHSSHIEIGQCVLEKVL